MFKIGQKVVCVDDSIGPLGDFGLVKNNIYTIENIYDYDGGLILKECKSRHHLGAWKKERFRPLVDDNFAEELLAKIKEEVQSEFQLN